MHHLRLVVVVGRGGGVEMKVIRSTMDHTCPGCHMLFSVGRQLYCRFLGHLSSARVFEVWRQRQSHTSQGKKRFLPDNQSVSSGGTVAAAPLNLAREYVSLCNRSTGTLFTRLTGSQRSGGGVGG